MRYYLWLDGARAGPYEAAGLAELYNSGRIDRTTPTVIEGQSEQWRPLKDVVNLAPVETASASFLFCGAPESPASKLGIRRSSWVEFFYAAAWFNVLLVFVSMIVASRQDYWWAPCLLGCAVMSILICLFMAFIVKVLSESHSAIIAILIELRKNANPTTHTTTSGPPKGNP